MTEEVVKIPKFAYQGINGAFGIQTNKTIDWERCRERFQNKTENDVVKSFLFYCADGTTDNVIKFIKTVESICDCPEDIKFKKTDHKNVIFVEMGSWWKQRVRRSLLTALLRCGQHFKSDTGNGFVEALNSEHYTSATREAVEVFLSGRTAVKMKKSQSFTGWHDFFAHKNKTNILDCLVKLKKKKPEVATDVHPVQ